MQTTVFNKLFISLPHKFDNENNESVHIAQRGLALNNRKPQFRISPMIDGTWLDIPKEQDSNIGAWPDKTVFPKGANPYPKNMPSSLRPPNKPTDFCIVNPNLKKLLLGPKIKEAKLNTTV